MLTKYKAFIFSEDPDTLVKFYTDILGLKIISELKLPRDYGYMLEVTLGYEIWLAKHSEVSGKNKEPHRHMLNLYADDVLAYYEKVKDVAGVEILQEPVSMSEFNPAENRTVFTFTDPEGNTLQIMNAH